MTSRSISLPDLEERSLARELDVTIHIRDAKYIIAHVNDSTATMAAFNQQLRHLTNFLRSIGASAIITPSAHVRSPAVYVFLEQELARRRGVRNQSKPIVAVSGLGSLAADFSVGEPTGPVSATP